MPDAQVREDVLQLASTIRSLTDQVSSLRVDIAQRDQPPGNNSSITVQAGGAAVWIVAWVAGLSCAFMLGAITVGGFWISGAFQARDEDRASMKATLETHQAYLNSIFQMAPQLKKEPE